MSESPTIVDMANADADGYKNGRKSVGLLTGKGYLGMSRAMDGNRVILDFEHRADALAAYNELSQIAELAVKP